MVGITCQALPNAPHAADETRKWLDWPAYLRLVGRCKSIQVSHRLVPGLTALGCRLTPG